MMKLLSLLAVALLFVSAVVIFGPVGNTALAEENGITTAMIQAICDQYGYKDNTTYWVYNETKDKPNHPKLPDDWYVGSTDSSYKTSNQIGSGKTLSYRVGGYYECAGYASFIGWKLTGVIPKTGSVTSKSGCGDGWKAYSVSEINSMGGAKPGDIIRNNSHSAVIYSVNSNGSFTVTECYGGSSNRIRIGKTGFNGSYTTLSAIPNVCYVLRYTKAVNNQFPYTSQGSGNNGFYRVKSGTGHLKEYPYADSNTKKTVAVNPALADLSGSNVLEVVDTVKNKYDNIWVKLKDGTFAYLGDLEFLFAKVSDVSLEGTTTQKNWKLYPFADAKTELSMTTDSMTVRLKAKYKNMYGNIWYMTVDGQGNYYINENNLTNLHSYITISIKEGSTWPGNSSKNNGYPTGNLKKSANFGLRGIIEATENIATVVGRVINASTGKDALSVTVKPNATTLNIQNSDLNNKLTFNTLPDGSYIYSVKATTVSGVSKELINSSFSIGSGSTPVTYSVTVTNDGNGTASASVASGKTGTEVTLTAIPNAGYRFKEWQVVSGGVTVQNDKFTIGSSNVTINAIFEKIPVYTVTVTNDGHGTGTANPSSGTTCTVVTLSATPNAGYLFKEWQVVSGGVSIQNNQFTIGSSNVEIKAIFEAVPAPVYTVTVTNDGNGTGAANPSSGVTGTVVTLTANPNAGYQFKEWQVISGGVAVQNNQFAIGNANVEIKAIFEAVKAKKKVVVKNGGKYELDPDEMTATLIAPKSKTATRLVIPAMIKYNDEEYEAVKIAASACKGMKKLKKVTIGSNVEVIGAYAFMNCKKLAVVSMGKSVEKIGSGAFKNCTALTSLVIPARVKSIGSEACYNCSKLKTVTIKTKKLKTNNVGKNAFKKNHKKAVYKCPSGKKSAYKKILMKKGGIYKTATVK